MTIAALVLATTLFHLHDPRINEASGVAVATREPAVWFTHNDSGDSARYFALGPTGQAIATYDLDGAHNVDWEDMAAAPDAAHVPTLWFGDIGDNDAVRKSIDVYATPEPHVTSAAEGRTLHVRAVRYRFVYPDGPHNAESLLVDPRTAQIYVATKSYLGDTDVYAAPAKPSATTVNPLRHIALLHWSEVRQPRSLEAAAPQLATTGGAFSPDAHTLVLRTYTDAYLFTVSGSGPASIARALAATPHRLTLPAQPQGEGVAFRRDGRGLVLTSEHKGSAVEQVPVPTTVAPAPASVAASPVVTNGAVRPPAPVRPSRSAVPAVLGGVAAVGVLVFGAWLWRRSGPAA